MMAFHHIDVNTARSLLLHDYGSLLRQTSATPSESLETLGRVVRYIGNERAIVDTAHGMKSVMSTVPLRVSSRSGKKQPVSLRLVQNHAGFAPKAPLSSISIARNSRAGVEVGSEGLQLTLVGKAVSGQLISDSSVFFGEVGTDMDAVVTPVLRGADLMAVLRSKLSPSTISYRVSLPSGAVLRASAGGAVVARGNDVLARIPAPDARDAQGVLVPVTMQVVKNRLILGIQQSENLAYPVLVDPTVVNISDDAGWEYFTIPNRPCAEPVNLVGTEEPLSIEEPLTEYPVRHFPACFDDKEYNGTGIWQFRAPMPVYATEFYGVKFSGEATGSEKAAEDLTWSMIACGRWAGQGDIDLPPPTTLVVESPHDCEGENRITIALAAGEFTGAHESVTVKGSLSVEAVLLESPQESQSVMWGESNPAEPYRHYCMAGDPVNCVTGNQVDSQVDLSVAGRGPALGMTRTYNSQLAVQQGERSEHGPFGYGWSGSYSAYLTFEEVCKESACVPTVTVHQSNGSTAMFDEAAGATYVPTEPLVQATLVKQGSEYLYTLPTQMALRFNASGRLGSEADADGNTLTMKYNVGGQLDAITNTEGREIALAYNAEGFVESATDPAGRVVKYTYENGNLVSVTRPGESSLRWQFAYNSGHELVALTDGGDHTTTFAYESSHRVVSEESPTGRARHWEYPLVFGENTTTAVTEPTGSVTHDEFNSAGLPTSVTHAYGTGEAATTTYEYDPDDGLVATTTPNHETTKFTYDAEGNRASETNPAGEVIKWTYNSDHEITGITEPSGVATTIERDAHGNPLTVSRSASGETTRTTSYTYNSEGDRESMTDAEGHTWSYEYDSHGNKISEVDPEGDRRTWSYNADSQETSTVSPRGHLAGAEASKYTTTIERNSQGEPVVVREPQPEPEVHEALMQAPGVVRLPSIVGVAEEDGTLVVEKGVWEGSPPLVFSYQWERCDALGMACVEISGATSATYSPSADDEGATLRVMVTASGPGGSSASASEVTETVIGAGGEASEGADFVSQFSSEGSEPGQISSAWGLATDEAGDIWVADGGNSRIDEFSATGVFLKEFGTFGKGEGQMEYPEGVAIGLHHHVFVTDDGNHRIDEFTEEGEFIRSFGEEGEGAGQLSDPEGLSVSADGDVYVADAGNNRVDEFTEEGTYVTSITEADGQDLSSPTDVAVSPSGAIYVAEDGADRIDEYTGERAFVRSFSSEGNGRGQVDNPLRLGIGGAHEEVWVSDSSNNRVEIFTDTGEYLTQFGPRGPSEEKLDFPTGIAVSGKNIYVLDESNHVDVWLAGGTPSNDTQPVVSGTVTEGEVLYASQGTWTGGGSVTYTYQWERCNASGEECKDIAGASHEAYTIQSGEAGATIRVLVTATDTAGSAAAYSETTAGIASATSPSNTVSATVSGTMQQDDILRVDVGSWSGVPEPQYKYEWQRCDSAGEACGAIAGATGPSYTLLHADVGQTIRVHVTATNVAGSSSQNTSVTSVIEPLVRETRYAYTPTGQIESVMGPYGETTRYGYNAANQRTTTEEPDGAVTRTEYDSEGQMVAQANGDGHTTRYERNALGEVTDVVEPGGRETKNEYDTAGQLTRIVSPSGKTTSYAYNEAGRLTGIEYSAEAAANVEYEYGPSGLVSKMTEGSGTTTYKYNKFGDLAEVKNGGGQTVAYEYDLDEEPTEITYPNGKNVERDYDGDGRLRSITDWLGNTTTYKYNADSDLTSVQFPSGTEDEDTYSYDDADAMTEATMERAGSTLAKLVYARGANLQVTDVASDGLPGTEEVEEAYNTTGTLADAGGTHYKYDPAGKLTALGETTYSYNAAEELSEGDHTAYSYNAEGQRIEETPEHGPSTSYTYNQDGGLASVTRPEEGATPKIEDSYKYNGEGLRIAEDVNGATADLTWDTEESLPLLLSDSSESYIYGPGGLPVEQINNGTEKAQYLHHDQAGSTRLITGSTGTVEGAYTYTPYGAVQEHTGTATTPLGYDGQYTSSDTGLIYLRARVYDPATAQFLSVDPDVMTTRTPYTYAGDNPLNIDDPRGLCNANPFSESFWTEGNCVSEGPLNPVPYYEKEIESYENGCGYFASVAHGLEGAVAATVLFAGGEGEDEVGATIEDALAGLRESKANIYEIGSSEELQAVYDELSHGGDPATPAGYDGEMVKLSDGTRIGLRNTSSSGGPTIDINRPGRPVIKIHLSSE